MASTLAATVDGYLEELSEDRRVLVSALRDLVNGSLPDGYEEGVLWGMIGWYVPHSRYPAGYHTDQRQPLPLAALASQKQYVSLYLMGTYCGCEQPGTELTADANWFRETWAATGKKLNMGKSCVRIKRLEDVAADVISEAIRRLPVDLYIAKYESIRPTARP